MRNSNLNVPLSPREIKSLEQYAQRHKLTATELLRRYAKRLLKKERFTIDPKVKKMIGILPKSKNAREEYHEYLLRKHT